MAGAVLKSEERTHRLRMMRRQKNSPVPRRMNVLLLLDDGWTAERIAEALYIDSETVREHRQLYQRDGISGLERLAYQGREAALMAEQREALTGELSERPYLTAKSICRFVRAAFGVA